MRSYLTFVFLLLIKGFSRLFWRLKSAWIGEQVPRPWSQDIRICAILHHTSLYEPIFAGVPPARFLMRIARHGVVPIAAKTLDRPVVGAFFKLVANNVVPITRKRDETWRQVVRQAGPHSMIIILPEGRMKRRSGRDSEGKPMTVRGGIADLLMNVEDGYMLIAYSGGLHHVQAPGERLPRLFKTVRMNLELVDIRAYRERLLGEVGEEVFRRAVVSDLESRRDRFCPTEETIIGRDGPVRPTGLEEIGLRPGSDHD